MQLYEMFEWKVFTTHIKVQMQNDINSFNKNNIVHMFGNSPQLK